MSETLVDRLQSGIERIEDSYTYKWDFERVETRYERLENDVDDFLRILHESKQLQPSKEDEAIYRNVLETFAGITRGISKSISRNGGLDCVFRDVSRRFVWDNNNPDERSFEKRARRVYSKLQECEVRLKLGSGVESQDYLAGVIEELNEEIAETEYTRRINGQNDLHVHIDSLTRYRDRLLGLCAKDTDAFRIPKGNPKGVLLFTPKREKDVKDISELAEQIANNSSDDDPIQELRTIPDLAFSIEGLPYLELEDMDALRYAKVCLRMYGDDAIKQESDDTKKQELIFFHGGAMHSLSRIVGGGDNNLHDGWNKTYTSIGKRMYAYFTK